jgi:WD40 repeat protein
VGQTSDSAADRERRLDEVIADYLADVDAGRAGPPGDYLRRHPDLRPELERFFAAQADLAMFTMPVAGLGRAFAGYELVERVGSGGVGAVYKARQRDPARVVAVKVHWAAPATAGPDRARFRREAEAAARLDHPHVVPIYAVGEHAGHPYLAMRYLEGGDLGRHLDRFHTDPRAAAALLATIADAVHFAHQRGVLHRDLKPSNILLDAGGQPYLADFGLALDLAGIAPSVTRTGELVGTFAYMAPEQAEGRRGGTTVATDVHGLGAVLYACLTGGPPFPGTAAEALDAARNRPPAPPAGLNPVVPADLAAICLKCLEKAPADRYPSAAAVADDLRRFLAGESVIARRASLARQMGKFARRRPAETAAGAAIALLGVGLAASVGWAIARDRAAATVEARNRDLEYVTLMNQVRTRAASRPPGWTAANRDDLARATAAGTSLRDPAELRSELARCLTAPVDFRPAGKVGNGLSAAALAFRPGRDELAMGERHPPPGETAVRVVVSTVPAGPVLREWKFPVSGEWEKRSGWADGVQELSFTPDGSWLVIGLKDGRLYAVAVDNPTSGPRLLAAAGDRIRSIVPCADGRGVYTASDDGTITRWAIGTWLPVARREFPDTKELELVGIGPDLIVSRARRHLLKGVWDVGKDVLRLDGQLRDLYRFTPVNPWGSRFAATPGGGVLVPAAAEIWAFDSERPFTATSIAAHSPRLPTKMKSRFDGVACDPAGRVFALATDGDAAHVELFDPGTCELIGLAAVDGGSGRAAFARDGGRLAVAAGGRTDLYDLLPPAAAGWAAWAPYPVYSFGFRADGREIGLVASARLLWEADSEGDRATEFSAWAVFSVAGPSARWQLPLNDRPGERCPTLAADPAGEGYLLGIRHRAFRLRTDRPPVLAAESGGSISAVATGADGNALWAGKFGIESRATAAGPVARWVNTPPEDRSKEGDVAAMAAQGTEVYAATRDGFTHLLELPGLRPSRRWELTHHSLSAAALTPDGTRGAVGGPGGDVWVQDLPGGTVAATGRVHRDHVSGLAFVSPDLLVSGSWDGTLALSRIEAGRLDPLFSLPLGAPVDGMHLSPDGVTLGVLTSGARSVRLIRLDVLEGEFARLGLGVDIPPARAVPPLPVPPAPADPDRSGWPVNALVREIFSSIAFERRVAIEPDDTLSHDRKPGVPHPTAPVNYFSVRWSGFLVAPAGRYRFRVEADGQASFWLDDRQVAHAGAAQINVGGPAEEAVAELTGQPHPLRLNLIEGLWSGKVRVQWAREPADGKSAPKWEDIPKHVLFHSESDALAAAAKP